MRWKEFSFNCGTSGSRGSKVRRRVCWFRIFVQSSLEASSVARVGVSRQSLYVKLRRHRLVAPAAERDGEAAD